MSMIIVSIAPANGRTRSGACIAYLQAMRKLNLGPLSYVCTVGIGSFSLTYMVPDIWRTIIRIEWQEPRWGPKKGILQIMSAH